MTLIDRVHDSALKAHAQRKATVPTQVANDSLHAGEPMYFYCTSCGWLADLKPEDYLFPVRKLCSECEGMQQHGWLPS